MSRYVDIEGDWVDEAIKTYSLGYYDYDEYAIPFEVLGSAPSIDICFCKDCKFSEVIQNDSSGVMARYCRAFTVPMMKSDDDFCSYGCRSEKPNNSEVPTDCRQTERSSEWSLT